MARTSSTDGCQFTSRDAGDPPIGMPGEDGDHAPVQGDGDEKAAAQLLEDARGTLRTGADRILCGCFFLGGMMSRNLVTRLLFVHIDLEFIDKLLKIDGFGCLWDLFRWTVPTRGRSSFLSAGHRWALPSVVRKPTKRGTDDLRSSVFYGCVAAVVQRFLPHVKTAPGQKLRNSSIFDRYPQEWPVSSAWKVFVVRCWADSGRMFHVHPFSSIFLCMSMRPKKSSKGLHQTIMPLLRLRGATSIRMISMVHQSLRIKVDK